MRYGWSDKNSERQNPSGKETLLMIATESLNLTNVSDPGSDAAMRMRLHRERRLRAHRHSVEGNVKNQLRIAGRRAAAQIYK